MNFDANTPIYLQIMDDFKIQLMKGTWKGGDKVASVRELAVQYGVNPNTIQRSLSELEREGYLYSERTSGRFITKDEERLTSLKKEYADTLVDTCIQKLHELNLSDEKIIERMKVRLGI